MRSDFVSFELGREDGTLLSLEEFISEHNDIVLTPGQWKDLFENLEVQAYIFICESRNKDVNKFVDYCKKIVFIDEQTNEPYFKPLAEIDIKVFFKNFPTILLIYDMKMSA